MKTKTLILVLLCLLSMTALGQQKKIALLEPRVGEGSTGVSGMEKAMVRGELRKAIVNHTGYEAFTRADIDKLMAEQDFQRTGMVSDDQIKKIGLMSGADYICISTLNKTNTEFYLEAYLVNVESAQISNPASQYGELKDGKLGNMLSVCQALAQELLGTISPVVTTIKSSHTSKSETGGSPSMPRSEVNGSTSRDQNYTETAFGIDMRMVYVEGGTFIMGCTDEQGHDCRKDELPTRETTVDSYYIGMLEVTQNQWQKVMGTTIRDQADGRDLHGAGDDYPMYFVSWNEVKTFCARLSRQTGKNYCLPTEAEWEYAARGGKMSEGLQYSGALNPRAVSWYSDISNDSSHPCGSKNPNELGIYDMSGNVWEWCEDWYCKQYVEEDRKNPKGAVQGTKRVIRGGSYSNWDEDGRVSNRDHTSPNSKDNNVGFRVVMHIVSTQ